MRGTNSAPWLVRRGILPEPGPKRILACVTLINRLGSGLFMTSGALFFTRSVGMSVSRVGLGLGIGAFAGLLASIPVGHIADRRGPRESYMATLAVEGIAMSSLVFVHKFPVFVAAICLVELAAAASEATRGPLVRGLAGGDAAAFRAYLRAVVNFAVMLSAAMAAIAIQLNTRTDYLALIIGNSASFFAASAVVFFLPHVHPLPIPPDNRRWVALRDRSYIVVSALNALLSIQYGVLLFALPLWIVDRTHAPRLMVGACVIINTAIVVSFQARASRRVRDPGSAANAMRRAGFMFLASMALIAAAGGSPWWIAALLVALGAAVHSLGEIWQGSAGYELSYSLALPHAQGQYSGVFSMGTGLSNAVAPLVLGALCIVWGAPGWIVMGLVFVLTGIAFPRVGAWAERNAGLAARLVDANADAHAQ